MNALARRVAVVCVLQIALWGLDAQAQREAAPQDLGARLEWLQRQGAVQLGQKPVYLQSTETPQRLEGEVLALIDHPVQRVRAALAQPAVWCDILILHLNVKYCRAVRHASATGGAAGAGATITAAADDRLEVGLGRKHDEPLSSVHWLDFRFRTFPSVIGSVSGSGGLPGAAAPSVELLAPEGPLDTRDIRITVQLAESPGGRTLLQLRYAYAQGPAARWAMQVYLGTVGRHKVGFSLVPDSAVRPAGLLQPVTGLRGLLERNTVRYYLAIDAYLDALVLPPAQQLERRLVDWFAATERHPRQLRELDWEAYVQMKMLEVRRQQTEPPPRH
jgi:hypothetical protein